MTENTGKINLPAPTQTAPPYTLGVASLADVHINETTITFDDIEDMIAHIRAHPVPEDKCYRLAGLDLSWRNFSGVDLDHCVFENCHLPGADFSDTLVEGTQFHNCDLRNTDFSHARIYNSLFAGCDVSQSSFRKAELKGTLDRQSDFTGDVFDGAEIAMCEFDRTDLSESVFSGAEMKDVRLKGVRARAANFTNMAQVANIGLEDTNLLGANLSAQFRRAAQGGTTFDPRVSAAQMGALKRIRKPIRPGGLR